MEDPERVCQRISRNTVVDFASDLIRVPTVSTGQEGAHEIECRAAPKIIDKMKEIGMKVHTQEVLQGRPNVVGTLDGSGDGPCLLFNGHVDVVSPGTDWKHDPFSPVVESGRLYGRGAADMKGGLASMICAAEALANSGVQFPGKLIVAAVSCEEIGGHGTEALVKSGVRADGAIIGEPTGLEVDVAHRGSARFDLLTRGKATHSSMANQGVNAIDKMLEVIDALRKYRKRLARKKHRFLGSPTLTFTLIQGGLRYNIVPDFCKLHVDARTIPGETHESRWNDIRKLLDALRKEDPELNVELVPYEQNKKLVPSETSIEARIVKTALKATRLVKGEQARLGGFAGACDMPYLVHRGRIPTIILGPGKLQQAHAIDEYVEVEELVDAAKIYAIAALEFLLETDSTSP